MCLPLIRWASGYKDMEDHFPRVNMYRKCWPPPFCWDSRGKQAQLHQERLTPPSTHLSLAHLALPTEGVTHVRNFYIICWPWLFLENPFRGFLDSCSYTPWSQLFPRYVQLSSCFVCFSINCEGWDFVFLISVSSEARTVPHPSLTVTGVFWRHEFCGWHFPHMLEWCFVSVVSRLLYINFDILLPFAK